MSFLTSLFGAPSQEEVDAQDAALRAMNERDYGQGGRIYNAIAEDQGAFAADQALAATRAHEDTGEAQDKNISGQIGDAFGEGINEGAANIRHAVDHTVTGVLGTVLKTIPITVWLAAVVVAFVYFGGWAYVSKRFLKR